MDLPNDSERDSYANNEQRTLADPVAERKSQPDWWDQSQYGDFNDMNETGMLSYSARLLGKNYTRWRHGLIGAADESTISETVLYLNSYFGVDVSAMTNDELIAYFKV